MKGAENIVIFGAGGTLGQAMCEHIKRVAPQACLHKWDRKAFPIYAEGMKSPEFDERLGERLKELQPDTVFNFAVAGGSSEDESSQVNVGLPMWLGKMSSVLGFRLVHTSSVMVFSDQAEGPFALEDVPDASSGYGFEKRMAEEALEAARQEGAAVITARIGWQIGSDASKNTMRRFLEQQAKENSGVIKASRLWIPSCSRLEDTVDKLWTLRAEEPGLYQIEGNWEGLDFATIVSSLLKEYASHDCSVEENDDFRYHQRMVDPRLSMPPLFAMNYNGLWWWRWRERMNREV